MPPLVRPNPNLTVIGWLTLSYINVCPAMPLRLTPGPSKGTMWCGVRGTTRLQRIWHFSFLSFYC
jgi:hypothetical protein